MHFGKSWIFPKIFWTSTVLENEYHLEGCGLWFILTKIHRAEFFWLLLTETK